MVLLTSLLCTASLLLIAYLQLVRFSLASLFNDGSVISSGASWVLFGTPQLTSPYDILHSSPFYLKGHWTAAKLGNHPKPVLIRIPRVTPVLVKGQDADQ